MQIAAVNSGYGYIVLVGVDAVVPGLYIDAAAVDGEVALAAESLVFGGDIELACPERLTADVHRALGVEGAVIFMQLAGSTFLIDFGNIRAAYIVC